jgi:hypothetical protein
LRFWLLSAGHHRCKCVSHADYPSSPPLPPSPLACRCDERSPRPICDDVRTSNCFLVQSTRRCSLNTSTTGSLRGGNGAVQLQAVVSGAVGLTVWHAGTMTFCSYSCWDAGQWSRGRDSPV